MFGLLVVGPINQKVTTIAVVLAAPGWRYPNKFRFSRFHFACSVGESVETFILREREKLQLKNKNRKRL